MAKKQSNSIKKKGGKRASAPKTRMQTLREHYAKYQDDTKYSATVARIICAMIADGQSIRTICADPEMPAMGTIFRWVNDHEDFALMYATARDMQADACIEDIIRLEDLVERKAISEKAANVSIRSKQWRAERTAPRKYSITQKMNISGHNDGPIKTEYKAESMNIDAIRKAMEEA